MSRIHIKLRYDHLRRYKKRKTKMWIGTDERLHVFGFTIGDLDLNALTDIQLSECNAISSECFI